MWASLRVRVRACAYIHVRLFHYIIMYADAVCANVCWYVCVYVHVRTSMPTYIRTSVWTHVHTRVLTGVGACERAHVPVCVCVSVCMWIRVCENISTVVILFPPQWKYFHRGNNISTAVVNHVTIIPLTRNSGIHVLDEFSIV